MYVSNAVTFVKKKNGYRRAFGDFKKENAQDLIQIWQYLQHCIPLYKFSNSKLM